MVAQNAFSAKIEKTPLDRVEMLAHRHFGVAGTASVLSSERDETFLIRTSGGAGYILKIASPQERADILQFQTEALAHLSAKRLAVPVPRPVFDKDGAGLVVLPDDGGIRIMRMLTYMEGVLLSSAPRLPGQMSGLGRALASIGVGLADFSREAPQQELIWDLCRASGLRQFVPHVATKRQAIVVQALDAYDRMVDGVWSDLPRQVIHNDFNPHNIVVDADAPDRVSGVIDFGDMVKAPAVNDLAVALAYHVFAGPGLEDVLAILRAYNAVRPLSAPEFDCLPTLLRTRLAMTMIISEWRSSLHPENSRYILRNHAAAHAGLLKLAGRSDAELATFFRNSTGDAA